MFDLYDEFNGIRVPATGGTASFEELVELVIQKKRELGIDVASLSVELAMLKNRVKERRPSIFRSGGGFFKSPGCCKGIFK